MGTPLNTQAPTIPSLKLRNVGDYADVAIVDVKQVPWYEYGVTPAKQRVSKTTGKLQTQDMVTVLYVGGKGVVTEDDVDRSTEPGEVVAIYFGGQNRWDPDHDKTVHGDGGRSWSGAQDYAKGLQVGDVMRWKFEAEIPGKGAQPRKLRTCMLRRARPEELEQARKCEDLRMAYQNPIVLETARPIPDEEPF
jgi:hypothetical protein